jgi:hypothetical protein
MWQRKKYPTSASHMDVQARHQVRHCMAAACDCWHGSWWIEWADSGRCAARQHSDSITRMIVWLCQLSGHHRHSRPGTRDDQADVAVGGIGEGHPRVSLAAHHNMRVGKVNASRHLLGSGRRCGGAPRCLLALALAPSPPSSSSSSRRRLEYKVQRPPPGCTLHCRLHRSVVPPHHPPLDLQHLPPHFHQRCDVNSASRTTKPPHARARAHTHT